MNNKGFMMAEVVVVSAIILVFLTGLYMSYNKLFSVYSTRVNYYDATTLYRLAYYRDVLIEEDKMNSTLDSAKEAVVNIFDNGSDSISPLGNGDSVFMIYNNQGNITDSVINSMNIKLTFSDYINYLQTSISFGTTNFLMVMESCLDENSCKYAYLEVYDGKET